MFSISPFHCFTQGVASPIGRDYASCLRTNWNEAWFRLPTFGSLGYSCPPNWTHTQQLQLKWIQCDYTNKQSWVGSRETETATGDFLSSGCLARTARVHGLSRQTHPSARSHADSNTLRIRLKNRKQSQEETHFSGVTRERLLKSKLRPSQRACFCRSSKESRRKMFEWDQTFGSISSKRFHCAFLFFFWGSFKVPHHVKCTDLYMKGVSSLSRIWEKPVLHFC